MTARFTCAACGRSLPTGTPAIGTTAPNGMLIALCVRPCGDRANCDDIFARQCVAAAMAGTTRAHLETVSKKAGFDLATDENSVRSIIRELSRSFEADNPGFKAPSFESIMAAINGRARQ